MYNMRSNLQNTELEQLVHNCYEQKDMNMKIETLYKINSMLPESLHMNASAGAPRLIVGNTQHY